jgi:hypothetical protein
MVVPPQEHTRNSGTPPAETKPSNGSEGACGAFVLVIKNGG